MCSRVASAPRRPDAHHPRVTAIPTVGAADTRRCLVIGSPIRHSRSPLIHRLFAEQFGLALRYEKREVAPGTLEAAIRTFVAEGILGVNVTVPLKEEAYGLATATTTRAELAGAANVLSFPAAGQVVADNTDGIGLVADLLGLGFPLAGARVLLLGAGGAVRGVVPALLAGGAATLTIANRTRDKAEALRARFAGLGKVDAAALGEGFSRPFDLIINGTSLGVTAGGELPVSAAAVGADTACYDLVYGAAETPFLRWAREAGALRRVDGLGMLVEQAAAAFECWHGLKPATAPVIAALRRRG
jgi:shikimate dehydrogenase